VKITPEPYGVRLRMPVLEADALSTVIDDVIGLLRGDLEPDDPVRQRLYPAGYRDDAGAEEAFRELTESSLREERVARAEECVSDLATARSRRGTLEMVLEHDGAQRWLQVLNDARLAIGTRIGVTEDDGEPDPEDRPRMAYLWLTAVQDALVHAVMASR